MKKKQGKRVLVAPNLYARDGHFFLGHQRGEKWVMEILRDAAGRPITEKTEAKRALRSRLAALDEGRVAAKDNSTFETIFSEWQESRSVALSDRTRRHERHLLDRHLAALKARPVQSVDSREVARLIRTLRGSYSEWTVVAVLRIVRGTFDYALRHKLVMSNPTSALARHESPRQRNKKEIRILAGAELEKLVSATASDRWRCAIALAAFGGLRLGEVRGLKWEDIDFEQNVINVRRSLLPEGMEKTTKTRAGERAVALFPAVRRLLAAWKLRSPYAGPSDYVLTTGVGKPIQQRNLRRVLTAAVTASGLEAGEKRLSFHSLRHSAGSVWISELGLPITTVSEMLGHSNPSFTLKCYGHESRDPAAVVEDVLQRAAAAQIGG